MHVAKHFIIIYFLFLKLILIFFDVPINFCRAHVYNFCYLLSPHWGGVDREQKDELWNEFISNLFSFYVSPIWYAAVARLIPNDPNVFCFAYFHFLVIEKKSGKMTNERRRNLIWISWHNEEEKKNQAKSTQTKKMRPRIPEMT